MVLLGNPSKKKCGTFHTRVFPNDPNIPNTAASLFAINIHLEQTSYLKDVGAVLEEAQHVDAAVRTELSDL